MSAVAARREKERNFGLADELSELVVFEAAWQAYRCAKPVVIVLHQVKESVRIRRWGCRCL